MSTPSALGPELREFASHLASIIGGIDAEVVFVTCLDSDGLASESECFASADKSKTELPLDELFHLPKKLGAPRVLVASKSSGSIDSLHERDLRFTERLIDAGFRNGVRVEEHLLVEGGEVRALSACTDLFQKNPGRVRGGPEGKS